MFIFTQSAGTLTKLGADFSYKNLEHILTQQRSIYIMLEILEDSWQIADGKDKNIDIFLLVIKMLPNHFIYTCYGKYKVSGNYGCDISKQLIIMKKITISKHAQYFSFIDNA